MTAKKKPTAKNDRVMYLPTIDGRPARWSVNQLCYCDSSRGPFQPVLLPSRRAVLAQIEKTRRFRERNGYGFSRSGYDWVRVTVPR